MGSTTRKTQVAGQKPIEDIKPNTTAGAVIPLQKYLDKAVAGSATKLLPPAGFVYPATVRSKHVAFSLMPLRNNGLNHFYAGVFDDEMEFSASLLKVAALFAAGQFHKRATEFAASYSAWNPFLADFNASLQAEINANADSRIVNFTPLAKIPFLPKTETILKKSAFPSIVFADGFLSNLTIMITESSDPGAAACIKALGYGFISAALVQEHFFADPKGIWLAGTYDSGTGYVRIPCDNDNDDAQITTSRQMCRLFSMIRFNQLPQGDPAANTLMQSLLSQAPTWLTLNPTHLPANRHLRHSRDDLIVSPLFTRVHAKIGVAGLGPPPSFPDVYSEGLIIKWNDDSQVASFNSIIDPLDAHPEIHLSGETAVCWQNLLAVQIPTGFDGIVEVINNSITDFLQQTPP